jgi:PIN domain nuclease of toxin-antitoxin system
MRLLLDTHAFLWFVNNEGSLSNTARLLIEDADNQPILSIASIWEMAVKVSKGKLELPKPVEVFSVEQLKINFMSLMAINISHIAVVARLPLHHKDPFDRMLIAQSMAEELPIISADAVFDAYGVQRLW